MLSSSPNGGFLPARKDPKERKCNSSKFGQHGSRARYRFATFRFATNRSCRNHSVRNHSVDNAILSLKSTHRLENATLPKLGEHGSRDARMPRLLSFSDQNTATTFRAARVDGSNLDDGFEINQKMVD